MRKVADAFGALPVEADEFVANMTAIDSAGEEAVAWFKAQFAAFDVALKAAGVFKEKGTDLERKASTTAGILESVDQIIKDEFDGDASKYAEALELANERSEVKLV